MEMFRLPTTIDKVALEWQKEYTKLAKEKNSGLISKESLLRFHQLNQLLSRFRLDPSLQLKEEDPVAKFVKERIKEKHAKATFEPKTEAELKELKEQVDTVLDNLFNVDQSKIKKDKL